MVVILAATSGGFWLAAHRHHPARPTSRVADTPQGDGGYAGHGPASSVPGPPLNATARPADPVRPVREAYDDGRYAEAEAGAERVIRQETPIHTVQARRRTAFALQILAYSAARRHDLKLARVRFADLRADAATLPGGGVVRAPLGDPQPALVQEAAFQHAVCTGALGDTRGAEAEYLAFMGRYPESPLVSAALKRLQRMHGGEAPPADEAVWKQAMATARARQAARTREASLCGPECLAELLRRRGEKADVHALAAQMGTSDTGSTLAALAGAARAHRFSPQGLALTQKGLAGQRMPAIALVAPGHYVLVEAVSPSGVTVWDPDARGQGHGDRRILSVAEWGRMWQGVTLTLWPPPAAVRTARR